MRSAQVSTAWKGSAKQLGLIRRNVTDVGETPAEIHRRMQMWSLVTVRNGLRELVRMGEITFDGPDGDRRYRNWVKP